MGRQINTAVQGVILMSGCLFAAQHIEAAPQAGSREVLSKSRVSSGARWKAHPEKGWVPAAEIEQPRGEKKENSKPAKKDLQDKTPKAN